MSAEIKTALKHVESFYPARLHSFLEHDRLRIEWQIEQVLASVPRGGTILDIGSGLTSFSPTLQVLGYKVTMVDDYGDNPHKHDDVDQLLANFKKIGTNVEIANMFAPDFAKRFSGSNMITMFDVMEHMHNSPKTLLQELYAGLSAGGVLWVSTPNCVNLRKRITGLLGRNKWSHMADWYEQKIFRGHVREPDIDDLHYIARDLGARDYQVKGCNWIGYNSPKPYIRLLTPILDPVMRLRPGLCSDIHLIARK